MKNAFGATLLFQIVIFFVVLFTGYICLSINQAKAFNVKNEVVKAVERNAPKLDGLGFTQDLKDIMEKEGYRLEGNCSKLDWNVSEDKIKGYNRNGTSCSGNNCAICIAEIESKVAGYDATYYKVATFYQLDIPILNSLFNLNAKGETKLIYKKG